MPAKCIAQKEEKQQQFGLITVKKDCAPETIFFWAVARPGRRDKFRRSCQHWKRRFLEMAQLFWNWKRSFRLVFNAGHYDNAARHKLLMAVDFNDDNLSRARFLNFSKNPFGRRKLHRPTAATFHRFEWHIEREEWPSRSSLVARCFFLRLFYPF